MHPRRTYFYLTTYEHQPIPEPSHFPQRTIISPSISSAASRSDDDAERRRELSPSPEIDLSTEFDGPSSPAFSSREAPHSRAASPPLEKDEKEFTQTARGMQKRQMSGDDVVMSVPSEMSEPPTKSLETDALFGEGKTLAVLNSSVFASSPAIKPSLAVNTKRPYEEPTDLWSKVANTMDWDLRSPELVELDELDDMFDDL